MLFTMMQQSQNRTKYPCVSFQEIGSHIVKSMLKGTDSLFVDDFALCVWGRSVQRVERAMQLCVNSVQNWVSENDFKFSPSKTACIHFCRQNGVFPEPTGQIYQSSQRSKIPWSDFRL